MHRAGTLRDLVDDESWSRARADTLAVVFKHSTRCWASEQALREVEQVAQRHPAIPIYLVDVLFDRELSRRIERDTGVYHHSPQVIVLQAGRATWHASHRDITAGAIEEHAGSVID